MSKATQANLTDYTAGTTTETLVKTIQCPLETSNRKNQKVRDCIDEWQSILSWSGDIMPSFPDNNLSRKNKQLYRSMVREFPDPSIRKQTAAEAVYKAAEAFDAWNSNGKPGDRPQFDGDGDYIRFHNQGFSLTENESGYGIKIKLQPYNPEWFHISPSEYIDNHLQPVVDGKSSLGSAELVLSESGNLSVNLVVKRDIEVYNPDDIETAVGVDLGENVIYAAAAVTNGSVDGVEMEPGKEFRHYREQLKRKRDRRGEQGDLKGVKKCKGDIKRYTEQVIHTASREIIDFAIDHSPCVIKLEEMGDYRKTRENPIHDWPRGMLQEQISYKATEAGIPVQVVDPAYTSQTCRKCGQTTAEFRDGADFHCRRCGYEVHADVNAAINISEQ